MKKISKTAILEEVFKKIIKKRCMKLSCWNERESGEIYCKICNERFGKA